MLSNIPIQLTWRYFKKVQCSFFFFYKRGEKGSTPSEIRNGWKRLMKREKGRGNIALVSCIRQVLRYSSIFRGFLVHYRLQGQRSLDVDTVLLGSDHSRANTSIQTNFFLFHLIFCFLFFFNKLMKS